MSDRGDSQFNHKMDNFADKVSDRSDPHDARAARSANMDATFGRNIGVEVSLSHLMRSDNDDTRREASDLFWENFRNNMRKKRR